MKQLTTWHGVKEPGQRRERLKGWGIRLEWLRETGKHWECTWLISERHWERIFSWTTKLLPASLSPIWKKVWTCACSSASEGRGYKLTGRKRRSGNVTGDKGKQLSYFLPQCWPQPQASPQLCLQCWRAEVRTRSRPAAGGQSARSWEGVRSLVTSDSKAECKLKKFMKLFLLSEQIPDKWSANKAGKFSAVPAVGRMLACSEPGIYWMLLIAVTAHTRTQACLFTTCIIAVTTQMQISGLSQEQRDISKTQRPEGKLR